MTAARRKELELLDLAIQREQAAMNAETPPGVACCPDCWQRCYLRDRYEKQERRERWRAVLMMKIARHNERAA